MKPEHLGPSLLSVLTIGSLFPLVCVLSVGFAVSATPVEFRWFVVCVLVISVAGGYMTGTRQGAKRIARISSGASGTGPGNPWVGYATSLGSILGILLVPLIIDFPAYWIASAALFAWLTGALRVWIPYLIRERKNRALPR